MSENTEFIENLKVGDKVAIFEGYVDENTLSEVVSITTKYIQVERYPSLRFDRQTGKQGLTKSGKRAYRYLFCPKELQIEKEHSEYMGKLYVLLDSGTITADKFEKCRVAIEQILKD
jgi:hypothetical protein